MDTMLLKTFTLFIIFFVLGIQQTYCQWEGYNIPPCYYNPYSQSGYQYPYSHCDGYDASYGQAAYPYGEYALSGFYGHGDMYDSCSSEGRQPIIIVVENKEKHDEFCFDDLISLSLDLVKTLPKDSCSCPSTWCKGDCCESRSNGRFEFYSECNCGPCNSCTSCKKSNKKSCCKSECGCQSCNSDYLHNCRNCKHFVICECY